MKNTLKYIKISLLLTCLTFLLGRAQLLAQPRVVDEIVAVVGGEIVLQSDVQIQKNQLLQQGYPAADACDILEQLLFEKLLLNQAKIDSIEVTDEMLGSELEKRINVFVRQIGSEEALEAYYKKSISEIKEEFRDILRDQMMVQQMQQKITSDVNVTPSDVQAYFKQLPADSLPYVNASVEMQQIVISPEPTLQEITNVREQLLKMRDQVLNGEYEFETLAVLYSDDPGSSAKGGELGLQPRGTFVPEFDAVAFKLSPGEISKPFKTEYGYHIMQLIERRGEMYNARHILLIPKISSADLSKAQAKLDSVATLIMNDSLTFAQAALRFSTDSRTKNQNGQMVNQATGSSVYEMDELDPQLFLIIDKLEVGEFSKPTYFQNATGKKGYRIIKLTNRTEPHRANLEQDYQMIQNAARQHLNQEAMEEWAVQKTENTYVRVADKYGECNLSEIWKKNSGDKTVN